MAAAVVILLLEYSPWKKRGGGRGGTSDKE